MSTDLGQLIGDTCRKYDCDPTRMMDIVRDVQGQCGCVSSEAMDLIAKEVKSHRVEVESVVSFYAFLSKDCKGKVVVRLCDDIVDRMKGCEAVGKALTESLGIGFGETTADGAITLEHAPCIGMCDQAPAMLVNDTVVTNLTPESAKAAMESLKSNMDPVQLVSTCGDGNNSHELVKAMVNNNIIQKGEAILADLAMGDALKKAVSKSPEEVVGEVKEARLRGRGGAGFPTGMKWDFTAKADGDNKTVICNADEGEPGTFKDRVILTEVPGLLFEGMAVAGYAIGASQGILYLRAEYAYLKAYLENVLGAMREQGILGANAAGKDGFSFDIRIQMGAGAYICGEETALISSCEGLRGDPKNRPPFPAQKGYLERPTLVNNVETFCCAARIMDRGAAWFKDLGNDKTPGTKLLSVSGDCSKPGVYEVSCGISVKELLTLCGAENAKAVCVGGPSGSLINSDDFGRCICYDDLGTGGAIIVFGPESNMLEVADYFMDFFIEESCGYCTPCRVGNVLLKKKLEEIMTGGGMPGDLEYLEGLGESVKLSSRCGLGQTSPNPILTTIKNFRSEYEALIKEPAEAGMLAGFDLAAAVGASEGIIGRESIHKS